MLRPFNFYSWKERAAIRVLMPAMKCIIPSLYKAKGFGKAKALHARVY